MKSKSIVSIFNEIQREDLYSEKNCSDDQIETIEKNIVSCIHRVTAENFLEVLTQIVELESEVQVLRLYSKTKIKQESLLELPNELKEFSCSIINKERDIE